MGAKLHRKSGWCRRWPVRGKKRCRLHGGMSTGARTREGKARAFAARSEGLRRWFAKTRAEKAAGLIVRFPGGRKSGSAWVTPRMQERKHLREIQELRAASALPPLVLPPRKRGRPSLADLMIRAKTIEKSPQFATVLERWKKFLEERRR
jgi:hypothetical protein